MAARHFLSTIIEKLGLGGMNMLLDFNEIKEITVPGMNNGTGMMTAK